METFKAEIFNKGRITIPITIRKLLDLNEGDIIEVTIQKIVTPIEQEVVMEVTHKNE